MTVRRRLDRLPSPALLAAATVALVASAVAAAQEDVPSWELRLTEWLAGAPDALAALLFPVMQLGTLVALFLAAVGIATRDRRLAVATLGAGLVTWIVAKGVKQIVERGRPEAFLPALEVRDEHVSSLGYISGHGAMAAVVATCASVVVPPRWRLVLPLLAGLVGLARIVYGVHLPADVIGGWAVGTLIGLGTLWLVDTIDARGGVSTPDAVVEP